MYFPAYPILGMLSENASDRSRWHRKNYITQALLYFPGRLDDDVFLGHIAMRTDITSRGVLDLIDDIHAINYLAKYAITPAILSIFLVQEAVIHGIDEELSGSAVRIAGASHGNRTPCIRETIAGLILDGAISLLLGQAWVHATTLNHELSDNPMENSSVVVLFVHIVQEVLNGFRGFVRIQFDLDRSLGGFQSNYGVLGSTRRLSIQTRMERENHTATNSNTHHSHGTHLRCWKGYLHLLHISS